MKKLLLIICFLLCASSIMANPLNEFYPENCLGFAYLEKDFFVEFMGLNNDSEYVTNYMNEIIEKTKEMMGLDLKEQVHHIGFFVVPDEYNEAKRFYFLEGNFNFSPIKTIYDEKLRSDGTKVEPFRDVEFSGYKVKCLLTGSTSLTYINNNILLLCNDIAFDMIKSDHIVFGKAPEIIAEMFEKRSNFIAVEKKALDALANLKELNGKFDFSLVKLVTAYIKNQEFVFELNCENVDVAEKLLPIVESKVKKLIDSTEEEYNKTVKTMDESALAINQKNFNSVYYSASVIDFLKSLKISSNENCVDITFTGDKVTLCNMIVYGYQNKLMPICNRIKEESDREACFYKQKAIVAAVERYNNEKTPSMTYLDLLRLSSSNYISHFDATLESNGCHYRNVGDLNKGGYIYCVKHGRVVPLIRPHISEKKSKEEADNYRCIANKEAFWEMIRRYNRGERYSENGRLLARSRKDKVEPITTTLDISALEKAGFFNKVKIEPPTPECEYYIVGDVSAGNFDNGTVACKKHGPLTRTEINDRGYREYREYEYMNKTKNIDEDDFE